MSKIDNGGPAFPLNSPSGTPDYMPARDGMSLRDYFAAQALVGQVTTDVPEWQVRAWFGTYASNVTRYQIAAKMAYAFAEAMMLERTNGGKS